jgi:hypothetical protein
MEYIPDLGELTVGEGGGAEEGEGNKGWLRKGGVGRRDFKAVLVASVVVSWVVGWSRGWGKGGREFVTDAVLVI